MKFKSGKHIMEAAAVVLSFALLLTGSLLCADQNRICEAEASVEGKSTIVVANPQNATSKPSSRAGIIKKVNDIKASSELEADGTKIEDTKTEESATDEENTQKNVPANDEKPQVTKTAKYPEWENRLISNVDTNMNIRSGPSTDYTVIGKLRRGDCGNIVEKQGDWYHITTGNVDGYVSAEFVLVGDEAKKFADEVSKILVKVKEGGLRVRKEASVDSDIVKQLEFGDTLVFNKDAKEVEGWVAVYAGSKNGYVSKDYVDVYMKLSEGITLEEEVAIEAEKRAERLREKARDAAESAAAAYNEVLKPAYPATEYEIYLMAAVIQSEAGGEPYYGQVAVASVIMNRVRSGLFPNNIKDVLYQPSQFYTAKVDMFIKNPQQSCIDAAMEAVGGRDNVEGRIGFMRAIHGHTGITIGHHTFFYANEW